MGRFEKQFEDLDVASEVMGGAMSSATAMTTPEDEVNSLMGEVADEYGIEFKADAPVIRCGAFHAYIFFHQREETHTHARRKRKKKEEKDTHTRSQVGPDCQLVLAPARGGI